MRAENEDKLGAFALASGSYLTYVPDKSELTWAGPKSKKILDFKADIFFYKSELSRAGQTSKNFLRFAQLILKQRHFSDKSECLEHVQNQKNFCVSRN